MHRAGSAAAGRNQPVYRRTKATAASAGAPQFIDCFAASAGGASGNHAVLAHPARGGAHHAGAAGLRVAGFKSDEIAARRRYERSIPHAPFTQDALPPRGAWKTGFFTASLDYSTIHGTYSLLRYRSTGSRM